MGLFSFGRNRGGPAHFPPVSPASFEPVHPFPPTDQATFEPMNEIGTAKGLPEEAEFGLVGAEGEEERFLRGEQIMCASSNVAAAQWLWHEDGRLVEMLFLTFHDGSVYSYDPISLQEARSFYNASSKGGWVWDELRIRGTSFGAKKNYRLVTSSSRLWSRSGAASQARHEAIQPSGEQYQGYHPSVNFAGAVGKEGDPLAALGEAGSEKVSFFTPSKAKIEGGVPPGWSAWGRGGLGRKRGRSR